MALAEALGRAGEPAGGLGPAALHQSREAGAGGRHRHADELLLAPVGVVGQTREAVGVALLLPLGVAVPVHRR